MYFVEYVVFLWGSSGNTSAVGARSIGTASGDLQRWYCNSSLGSSPCKAGEPSTVAPWSMWDTSHRHTVGWPSGCHGSLHMLPRELWSTLDCTPVRSVLGPLDDVTRTMRSGHSDREASPAAQQIPLNGRQSMSRSNYMTSRGQAVGVAVTAGCTGLPTGVLTTQ